MRMYFVASFHCVMLTAGREAGGTSLAPASDLRVVLKTKVDENRANVGP